MEQFITSLYNLVETCDFGDLKNEMICDRIVVGIWDQALSERLQTVADLTLEKAHNPCPAKRSGTRASAHPERLIKGGQVTRLGAKAGYQLQGQETLSKEGPKCIQGPYSCGRCPCPRHLCPAKDSECHKCHKRGHYSAQCLSKSAREICDPPETTLPF